MTIAFPRLDELGSLVRDNIARLSKVEDTSIEEANRSRRTGRSENNGQDETNQVTVKKKGRKVVKKGQRKGKKGKDKGRGKEGSSVVNEQQKDCQGGDAGGAADCQGGDAGGAADCQGGDAGGAAVEGAAGADQSDCESDLGSDYDSADSVIVIYDDKDECGSTIQEQIQEKEDELAALRHEEKKRPQDEDHINMKGGGAGDIPLTNKQTSYCSQTIQNCYYAGIVHTFLLPFF
jgi:hypothetical protein